MKKFFAVAAVLAAVVMVPVASAAENEKRAVGPAGYDSPGQGTLVLAGPSGAAAPVVGSGDHVVICHAIGGANGTDFNQIAPSAGVVFGHDGHEGDRDIIPPFVYEDNQGNQDRTLENGNNWTAANIAVYQNGCNAPSGNPGGGNPGGGNTDICPNIDGDQATVPVGTVKNTTGDCVDDSEVSTEPVCFGLGASEMLVGNPEITVNEGGTKASITFTVKNGCELELSLTSYSAANTMAFPANLPQTLFDNETRTLAQGTYTMMVALPACFYQVDFYYGPVLATVGEDGHGDRLIDFLHGGKACQTQQPVIVTVPGPERIVTVEKIVEVAGPERVVEKTVQIAGPERIVEVAGPTQVVERIVTVEKPGAVAQTVAPATKTITKVVTKTKVKHVVKVKRVVKIKRVVTIKRVAMKAKAKRPVVKAKRTSARRNTGAVKAERPRVLPFTP